MPVVAMTWQALERPGDLEERRLLGSGLDASAVTAWMETCIAGVRGPIEFNRVGRGRSNLTYRVNAAGARLVVRRPPLGELLDSAHDMRREYRVLSALHRAGLPVPEPLALCEDVRVTGAPFYVMEYVDGVVLEDVGAAKAQLDVHGRARTGPALARTLAELHGVDLDKAGLADLGRGTGYAERQLRRWSRQWQGTRTRDLPLVDELAERLALAAPSQPEVTLLHGDYSPGNVIFDPDGGVRAVLDWELATLGDPIADVAWLGMWWIDDARAAPLPSAAISVLPGFLPRAEVLRTYSMTSGRSLERFGFWTVLSLWKLAIIVEGVHRRRLEHSANAGVETSSMGPEVGRLVKLADVAARNHSI